MDNKEIVKENLKKILIYYGAKPSDNNWQCIPGRHQTPNYDLSVKEDTNVCCCHCGIQGDSFNVIAEIERYDLKKDFGKIISKGLDIIGNYSVKSPSKTKYNMKNSNKNSSSLITENVVQHYNYLTNIINHNYSKENNYNYFINRGIKKRFLYDKYKFIVQNPTKIFKKDLLPKLSNIWAYQYIIPVWENGQVVNCLLRRNDFKSTRNKKIMNLNTLKLKIFNADYLKEKNNKCLFLTEGIFDCLSYENEGYKAIALNSVVMVNQFLKLVEININNLLNTVFFIAFDADLVGNQWREKLYNGLKKLKLEAYKLSIKNNKYKDVNEYYTGDKNAFKTSINWLNSNIIMRLHK